MEIGVSVLLAAISVVLMSWAIFIPSTSIAFGCAALAALVATINIIYSMPSKERTWR